MTNMAAKSEAEMSREKLRRLDQERDNEENRRTIVKPALDRTRDGGIR
jgi:hypothetical protein